MLFGIITALGEESTAIGFRHKYRSNPRPNFTENAYFGGKTNYDEYALFLSVLLSWYFLASTIGSTKLLFPRKGGSVGGKESRIHGI